MRRWFAAVVVAIAFVALFPLSAWSVLPAALDGQPLPSLAPMLDRVIPGVVNISTRTRIQVQENPLLSDPFFRRFFDLPNMPRQRESQSLGSGVVVDAAKGYILTNHHVINKADEVTVTFRDGRSFVAKLVGTDPDTDVAVIQIQADKLTAVTLGDSSKLRVGDFVVAIGNPFGLGQTVTSGIVSALGRSGLGIEGYEDFIQTDASINPGNSGGALVNLRGELIGVNTAIVGPNGGNVGIGFAIPVNMTQDIMTQLIQFGEVRRGRLGVAMQDLTPELAKALNIKTLKGAIVAQVVPGSPADKAGLHVGDVVVSMDGRPVISAGEVRNIIGLMRIGDKVTMEVTRDGQRRSVKVAIAPPEQAKEPAIEISRRLGGAVLGPLEENHPLYGKVEGVLVLNVEPNSPAWNAGLRRGDLIVSANRQPVKNVSDLRNAAKQTDDRLLLNIRRGGGALFLLIQ